MTHTESKIQLTDRETDFEKYYRLSFIAMKLAIYNLEMASGVCVKEKRGVKRCLELKSNAIKSHIQDIALYLKADYWRALQDDMNSDAFPAIGNVANEFAVCANLLDIEDDIISEIRKRKVSHEELETA